MTIRLGTLHRNSGTAYAICLGVRTTGCMGFEKQEQTKEADTDCKRSHCCCSASSLCVETTKKWLDLLVFETRVATPMPRSSGLGAVVVASVVVEHGRRHVGISEPLCGSRMENKGVKCRMTEKAFVHLPFHCSRCAR